MTAGADNIHGSDATATPSVGVEDCGASGATTLAPPCPPAFLEEIDGFLTMWDAYLADLPCRKCGLFLCEHAHRIADEAPFHDLNNTPDGGHNHAG